MNENQQNMSQKNEKIKELEKELDKVFNFELQKVTLIGQLEKNCSGLKNELSFI